MTQSENKKELWLKYHILYLEDLFIKFMCLAFILFIYFYAKGVSKFAKTTMKKIILKIFFDTF